MTESVGSYHRTFPRMVTHALSPFKKNSRELNSFCLTSRSHFSRKVHTLTSHTKEKDTFVQRLKEDEKNLFENFPDRPSYETLGKFCELSYEKPVPRKFRDWELLDEKKGATSGYHGIAYINSKLNQIVVVHQGTDELIQWEQNWHGIALGKITDHLAEACEFVDKMQKEAEKREFTLIQTGHSLGAWLAEVIAFELMQREKFFLCPTVTFDSPNSRRILEKLQYSIPEKRRNLKKLDVFSIFSSPNPVNTLNPPLRAFRVYPKIPLPEDFNGLIGYKNYVKQSHEIRWILTGFNSKTGLPEPVKEVFNWPLTRRKNSESTEVFLSSDADKVLPEPIRGVINFGKLLFGNLVGYDTKELSGWYEMAKASNDFDPKSQEFLQNFILKHAHKYEVKDYNMRTTINRAHFSEPIREFVKDLKWYLKHGKRLYREFSFNHCRGMDPRILDVLFKCEIGKYTLKIPEGPISVFDLRRYLTHLHHINPDAFDEFGRRCSQKIRGSGNLTEKIEKLKYYLYNNSTPEEIKWVKQKIYPELDIHDLLFGE